MFDGGRECRFSAEVISPIIAEGDPIGAVVILSKNPGIKFGDLEVKLAETAAGFLPNRWNNREFIVMPKGGYCQCRHVSRGLV